jgi:molecular chaperone DnaK
VEKLSTEAQAIGPAMYGQQGAGPDGAAPGGAPGTDSSGGAEDVVDAEIVDEGDKK